MFSWLYWTFRSLTKVLLRKITKLCELQRICYSTLPGAERSSQVEYSLQHSKQESIQNMMKSLNELSAKRKLRENLSDALNQSVLLVINCKTINPRVHVQFIKSFGRCLEHIWGYKELLQEVKFLSSTPYDSNNEEHEKKLKRLWDLLNPDHPLNNRISKQWQDIGFQGNDPKTDFRGMGVLGLDNLLFFASEYNDLAKNVLQHSLHPVHGFAFAILGINITSMAYNMLLDESSKTHFFNVSHRMPSIDTFHHFYCYLFVEFDKFWIKSKPNDIMDFLNVRQKFEAVIHQRLSNRNCVFRIENTLVEI